jgi:Putative Actinobacterial Holin-X, holin superfamily III
MDEASAAARAEGSRAPAVSLPTLLRQLAGDVPGLVSDRIQLLSLEVRRAGLALAQMIALVVAIGVLAATAWVALWVGAAAALLSWGLAPGWVVLIVIGLNLGAAAIAAQRVRHLVPLLALPATVRRLTVPSAAAPTQPAAPVKAPTEPSSSAP